MLLSQSSFKAFSLFQRKTSAHASSSEDKQILLLEHSTVQRKIIFYYFLVDSTITVDHIEDLNSPLFPSTQGLEIRTKALTI